MNSGSWSESSSAKRRNEPEGSRDCVETDLWQSLNIHTTCFTSHSTGFVCFSFWLRVL